MQLAQTYMISMSSWFAQHKIQKSKLTKTRDKLYCVFASHCGPLSFICRWLIYWFRDFLVQQKSFRWLGTPMRKCLEIRELYCFWANKIWHNVSCVIFLEYLRWRCPSLTHEVKKSIWRIPLHKFFRRFMLWKTLNIDPWLA